MPPAGHEAGSRTEFHAQGRGVSAEIRTGERSPGVQAASGDPCRRGPRNPALLGLAAGLRPAKSVRTGDAPRSPRGGAGRRRFPGLCWSFRIADGQETVAENGQSLTRSRDVMRELTLSPEAIDYRQQSRSRNGASGRSTKLSFMRRSGKDRPFRFPAGSCLAMASKRRTMDLIRAELRFGVSDPRGLGANPQVKLDERTAAASSRAAESGGGRGFFAWIDATDARGRNDGGQFDYELRGNSSLDPRSAGGETVWKVRQRWPHPSFGGDFLPGHRTRERQGLRRRSIGSAISLLGGRWCRPATWGRAISSRRSARDEVPLMARTAEPRACRRSHASA